VYIWDNDGIKGRQLGRRRHAGLAIDRNAGSNKETSRREKEEGEGAVRPDLAVREKEKSDESYLMRTRPS